jgi:hypothetical protein
MTTISICNDITATLSDRKAEQYNIAMRATESRHMFVPEDLWDWETYDELWVEEDEAWERFFS